jgi:AraC-like DNA-binding protein
VRFRVGAAGAALGLPAAELLDLDVRVEDLWGRAGRRLEQRVAASHAPLSALVAALGDRAAMVRPDPLVRRAAALMLEGWRVESVTKEVALSERQLRRRFDRAVGYGPATLLRVQRFQRFLSLARQHPGTTLARLAFDAGYADQAHLTRECARLSGLTPKALLADGADAAGEKAELFKLSPPLPATMAA